MDISNNILKIKEKENENENEKTSSKIKHIVISGGGATGFAFYGILRESNKANLWNIADIKTIFCTSIGSVLAVFLCLKFEWDILDNYLIQRPWQKIFNFDIYSVLRVFDKRGIFSISVFEQIFQPLFLAADISMDITLKEFYEITKIELHIFVTEINNFEIIDASYITHPEWKLIQTVYASSTIPIVFEPWCCDKKLFIDGGFLLNNPMNYCIRNGAKPEEIMGLNKTHNLINHYITEESSFFDYLMLLINRILDKILNYEKIEQIEHEINIIGAPINIQDILYTASSIEERERLIKVGVDSFKIFYEKRNNI